MQVLEAHKPFEIQESELSHWQQRPVKNNFFELVLVKSGTGTQCINYNFHDYGPGSIFLLPPLQCHSFQIAQPSHFVFLKFTSHFFRARTSGSAAHYAWFKEVARVLANYNQLPGDLIRNNVDRQHLSTLVDMILRENKNYSDDSVSLIQSLMASVLEILLRNIRKGPFFEIPDPANSDDRISSILVYINENITNSALLRVDELARRFHLSPTYLGEYFRKNVNVSLREYIIKTKLRLVEIRLLNSDLTLTEIAEELSFTDVSHLSKTFKRYVGISLSQFRKEGEYHLLKRNACAV